MFCGPGADGARLQHSPAPTSKFADLPNASSALRVPGHGDPAGVIAASREAKRISAQAEAPVHPLIRRIGSPSADVRHHRLHRPGHPQRLERELRPCRPGRPSARPRLRYGKKTQCGNSGGTNRRSLASPSVGTRHHRRHRHGCRPWLYRPPCAWRHPAQRPPPTL